MTGTQFAFLCSAHMRIPEQLRLHHVELSLRDVRGEASVSGERFIKFHT